MRAATHATSVLTTPAGPNRRGSNRSGRRSTTRRRLLAGGLAALVAGAGLALVPAIAPGAAAPATADGLAFNPFDNAGGFTVYARGDANLQNSEIEGAIAVGGTLTAKTPGGRLPINHYVAGTADYTAPVVDDDTTRALIGAYSSQSGILELNGQGLATPDGYAKLTGGEQAPFHFSQRGSFTQYVVPGGEADGPSIDAKLQPWNSADPGATFRTAKGTVAEYVEQGAAWSEVDGRLAQLADPATGLAHHVDVAHDGDRAVLSLQQGVPNVIDYADLLVSGGGFPNAVSYAGVLPSADTPLVVRVPAKTTSVTGMALDGGQGSVANFVMWDLSAVHGAVAMAANSGVGRIDGSVYAPHADLTLTVGPLDGQVIANTLTTTAASGELHGYFYRAPLTTDPTVPTTPATGSFSIAKALDGPVGLVPASTEFTITYRVDGGEPIALALRADGTRVTVPGLAAGAIVTFEETTPPVIVGVTWTGARFSPDSVQIVGDEDAPVTITNAFTATPLPQPEPNPQPELAPAPEPEPISETTPAPAASGTTLAPTGTSVKRLASTGVDLAAPAGVAAGALALGALGLVLALRRRTVRR
ncbi:collagen-binding domain-containing protein [Agromyces sp. MMS24-JH15]|uniref:collagen-binding domain-containing protein n=1 Tax=Agromyces sp. MMS24-JH15 TaxID=3243765 RepID=UPI0037493C0D